MARPDLLALTDDDLAAMTNRGTVKRARRELEANTATAHISEDVNGTVTVEWSDSVVCRLPGDKTVRDAACSCVAAVLCRHVVRSVLAYQMHQTAGEESDGSEASSAAMPEPWDPGIIEDAVLERTFSKATLTAARNLFGEGLLVELVRSAKPTARFHPMACTLRFLVPGDIRYTHCDCAEVPPCSHALLAVWAFRLLAPGKTAGLVTTQQVTFSIPTPLLDSGEALLRELAIEGLSTVGPSWRDRVLRLAGRCVEEQLIWPGRVLMDLVEQWDRYTRHDARFSPEQVAALAGEWLIRSDAIRNQTASAPQLLIRGSRSDRAMAIGGGRFIGLGCDVQERRGGVEVTAYLQDADSGTVVGVGRSFEDPPENHPGPTRDFHQLAETHVLSQTSLTNLGAGQLLTHGGKRDADHRLAIGRSRAAVSAQGFEWQRLRAPALVEDFQELRARLGMLPPASLRPRWIAENLHICPVMRVAAARFNETLQAVEVWVEDARRETALMLHPYTDRGRQGIERMLTALGDVALRLKYVSAHARLGGADNVMLSPVMLVFEGPQGPVAVQPWVDRSGNASKENLAPARKPLPSNDRIAAFPSELQREAAEFLLLGLRRSDPRGADTWRDVAEQGATLGFERLMRPVNHLVAALADKSARVRWNPDAAATALLELAALTRLAQDITPSMK